ncbi:MAG TPA: DUF5995 family protein [Polyangiaceae bacterium]|nr:DUF5995 family protein [Polyangiaceae bacterium]
MDPSTDALQRILQTPVNSAADALTVLGAIVDALPPTDGIHCFSRLYQVVTDEVRRSLGQSTFHDPAFMDRLDANFANLYFDAIRLFLDGSPKTPRAWYPLFLARSEPRAALQFAFAGMNAHINRDLPVALVKTYGAAGIELSRTTPEYADYCAINPLLAQVEARIKTEFLTGPVADVDHVFGKVDDLVANFSIVEARAGAWSQGETFWALRKNDAVYATLLDSLDGLVGFASRGLLLAL